jgi:F0F1-type ATP synthase delta subunit
MTKDDIIRMAHKAGFLIDTHAQQYQPNCILSTYGLIDENLQRFATLVAAAERGARLAAMVQSVTKAVDTAMALEREVCAKLVQDYPFSNKAKQEITAAIRARGEKV